MYSSLEVYSNCIILSHLLLLKDRTDGFEFLLAQRPRNLPLVVVGGGRPATSRRPGHAERHSTFRLEESASVNADKRLPA